jgi:hypothetical protein
MDEFISRGHYSEVDEFDFPVGYIIHNVVQFNVMVNDVVVDKKVHPLY